MKGEDFGSPFFYYIFFLYYLILMLTITKQDSTYWYVTASEKVTISNPYFLFSIKSRLTDTIKNFILTDVSTHTERYNKFLFDEGIDDAKTLEIGEHEYKIYAQVSSNNLNPNNADELVETGILKVIPLVDDELFYEVS